MLVGRATQCSDIRTLLDAAVQGQAGVLLIRGEIGIGKTRMVDFAVEAATDFSILRVAGHEAETELSFAALSWLLDPLTELLPQLPESQSNALAGALNWGPVAAGGDRLTVAAATLTLLAAAADERPVLVVVDDVHWLDLPSMEAIIFAARRLKAERIAVILAARSPEDAASPLRRWLGTIPELVLPPLPEPAAWELVDAHSTGWSRTLLAQRIQESAGNPLALLEFPKIGPEVSPVQPLPISRRLELAYGSQITAQPQSTQRALLVLAAVGSQPSVAEDVLLPALDLEGLSATDLEPAETSGLVLIDERGISFRHPLVRSALYQSASPADRRAAHRALAEAFRHLGGTRAAERRGWHLAAASIGPDEQTAADLDAAAAGAVERRSYATAMDLYRRAARLTPPGLTRARRLIQAAYQSLPSGQIDLGQALISSAQEETDDPHLQTEARALWGRIGMWGGQPALARDLTLAEARRIAPQEPIWAALMSAHVALVTAMMGEQRMASEVAGWAAEQVTDQPDLVAVPVLLVYALTRAISGHGDEARELLIRCEPGLMDWDPLSSEHLLLVAAQGWESLEEPAHARRLLEYAVRSARQASAAGLLPFQLSRLAVLEFRAGDWAAAYSYAHDALVLSEQSGWQTEVPNSLVTLATIEAGMGRGQECRQHAERAIQSTAGATVINARVASALGLLELAEGRAVEATAHFAEVGRFCAEHELGDPVLLNWAGDLVEALVRAGQPDRADAPYQILAAEAASTARPTEVAIAARCRGLLAASPDDADKAFAEALEWHGRAAQPFDAARTWLCYGEMLRRQRRRAAAREALETAAEQFDRLGAKPWSDRAHGELRASGATARPRRESPSGQLTPQELQVAMVVADGASNAEAAAQLFLSPKTIEYHLSNTYRKLGLRSRGQLARAIADGRPTAG
ncbi:LuxR family transcriptional regulator [Fodinicola feengrottensis]|uniref:LuxR family transcriptional regulator n=1 Tax=Fodinicola feengrottensis TaxID=435914 RepID=A0ABN2G6Z3_9ACTN